MSQHIRDDPDLVYQTAAPAIFVHLLQADEVGAFESLGGT
jgi:hypothetical protein